MAPFVSYPIGAPVTASPSSATTSRYCIGIDLGTTNCALAYIDTLGSTQSSTLFPIPQHLTETTIGVNDLLPSNVALLDSGTRLVGRAALELMEYGAVPVVSSAKSWLIVDTVDRREPFLPRDRVVAPPATKLSPVEASALYLSHLREQWNEAMASFDPTYRLEHQQVIVTVPASFDPIAQELTREAILRAGLPADTTLLEEPVAAFHHFLEQDEAVLSHLTKRPANLLVVDIGGGTTDFSLLELDRSGELRRVKVGEHLLIGGDTIDLAIAHLVQKRVTRTLSPRSWTAILYQARRLKEQYLSSATPPPTPLSLTIPGEGSNLFASTETITLSPEEFYETIIEGFFPTCERSDTPGTRTTALREAGLPFPTDVAITRHLAAFLDGTRVDAILYTGGTLLAPTLQDRITRLLTRWQQGVAPVMLPNRSHLLAVAHGAARAALSTRNLSRRVAMAYPRSLYLEVGTGQGTTNDTSPSESSPGTRHLLCIFAQGHHTGDEVIIENTPLIATTNEPVRLQLYSSTMRPDDREGELVPLPSSATKQAIFHPLPPATTILATDTDAPTPSTVPVQLAIQLTEVGSLSLSCIARGFPHRWTIEFHLADERRRAEPLRAAPNTDTAVQAVKAVFAKGATESPAGLLSRLEKLIAAPRDEWNVATLRALWSPLADSLTRRGKTPKHEVAWLQCAGHALRPGIGDESDSLRINELWRIRTVGTPHRREPAVALATQILWRRVAAGLSAERQRELYEELMRGDTSHPETLRLLSSLERLPEEFKQQLVTRCLKVLRAPAKDTQILGLWCLTRLATHDLVYAAPRYALWGDATSIVVRKVLATPNLPEPHRSRAVAYLVRGREREGLFDEVVALLDGPWREVASGGGGEFTTGEGADSSLVGDSLPPGVVLGRSGSAD